jgi:hypothetical protein
MRINRSVVSCGAIRYAIVALQIAAYRVLFEPLT